MMLFKLYSTKKLYFTKPFVSSEIYLYNIKSYYSMCYVAMQHTTASFLSQCWRLFSQYTTTLMSVSCCSLELPILSDFCLYLYLLYPGLFHLRCLSYLFYSSFKVDVHMSNHDIQYSCYYLYVIFCAIFRYESTSKAP